MKRNTKGKKKEEILPEIEPYKKKEIPKRPKRKSFSYRDYTNRNKIINIISCKDCHSHLFCTRHDEDKYEKLYDEIKE